MSVAAGYLPGRRTAEPGQKPPLRPPSGRRDRRGLVLIGSVALVAACIASFAALYSTADRKVPALVMVRTVAQGQQVTSADLGTAQVAVSAGVDFIPLDQAQMVSGKRAASAIPAGALLTLADLTGAPAIPSGDAVVGVALKDGAYPTGGLAPGDQVLVVQTAAPGAAVGALAGGQSALAGAGALAAGGSGTSITVSGSGAAAGDSSVLVPQATVSATAVPGSASSGGVTLLASIDVPAAVAAQVATAAAAGQVGLVLLPTDATAGAAVTSTGVHP